jgi:hypothetical protein
MGGKASEEEDEDDDEEPMDLFTFQARGGGGGRSSAAGAGEAASATLVFQFEVHDGFAIEAAMERARAAAGAAGVFSRAPGVAGARVGAVVHAKADRMVLV